MVHAAKDVIVGKGVTLTVSAGTLIQLDSGVHVFVDGTLKVSGSAAAGVVFTPASTGGSWAGIVARAGGALNLAYTTVEHGDAPINCDAGATQCQADHTTVQHYAATGVTTKVNATFTHLRVEFGGSDGLYVNTPGITVTISDSVFHNTGGDAIVVDQGNLDFQHNTVHGDVVGGNTPDQHCANHFAGNGTFTIKANDFSRSVYGFMASGLSPSSVMTGNNFFDNGTTWGPSVDDAQGHPVEPNVAVQLQGNYWGGSVPQFTVNATVDPSNPSTFSAIMIPGTGVRP
jgi:hypothetical protein